MVILFLAFGMVSPWRQPHGCGHRPPMRGPRGSDGSMHFFEDWRSGDEYEREAITWVMAGTSHFPGVFIHCENQPNGRNPKALADI
jgi:hypothetical protein